jgi:hypothetical protein
MLRIIGGSLLALVIVVTSNVVGDEVKGRVKTIDVEKNTITLTVNEKDQTFTMAKDPKVTGLYGKKLKKAKVMDVPGGLSGVKTDAEVTITTTTVDEKTTVSEVKLEGLQAKQKKKKNNNP